MLDTNTVLSDTVRRQMRTPVVLNSGASHGYGFGW